MTTRIVARNIGIKNPTMTLKNKIANRTMTKSKSTNEKYLANRQLPIVHAISRQLLYSLYDSIDSGNSWLLTPEDIQIQPADPVENPIQPVVFQLLLLDDIEIRCRQSPGHRSFQI